MQITVTTPDVNTVQVTANGIKPSFVECNRLVSETTQGAVTNMPPDPLPPGVPLPPGMTAAALARFLPSPPIDVVRQLLLNKDNSGLAKFVVLAWARTNRTDLDLAPLMAQMVVARLTLRYPAAGVTYVPPPTPEPPAPPETTPAPPTTEPGPAAAEPPTPAT